MKRLSFLLLVPLFTVFACNRSSVNVEYTNAENEVPVLGNLVFRFSNNLATDSMLNRWDSTEYIRFSPVIKGRFRWESKDRSFPAMKTAVTRFKDNPDVKFLFIHTWEKEDSAAYKAKKYVDDNYYPFTVLMDMKDPSTGVNNVVDSYKVNGIPAKFVIDKKGNIRFFFSGFSGGEDAAVEEIAAMVELADKG